MKLEYAAKKAMDYLGSVGVAADWEVSEVYGYSDTLVISIDERKCYSYKDQRYMDGMLNRIIRDYPLKSP